MGFAPPVVSQTTEVEAVVEITCEWRDAGGEVHLTVYNGPEGDLAGYLEKFGESRNWTLVSKQRR